MFQAWISSVVQVVIVKFHPLTSRTHSPKKHIIRLRNNRADHRGWLLRRKETCLHLRGGFCKLSLLVMYRRLPSCLLAKKYESTVWMREDRHHLHDTGCRSRDRTGEFCWSNCCSDGSICRLEYYTRPQGQEKEPKLPPRLAGPLHKIIMTTNLNPVKIVMMVKENSVLVDVAALEKCYQVMDLLCEQCVKQQDMNEVLAMKMHYISCVLQKCVASLEKQDEKLDTLVKCLLRGRDSDGFPQYQEKFIRDCIKKFPYCEVTLLQQLVRSIAPVDIGNDPTAYSVLTQALTGQVVFVDADYCATCGDRGADKWCSLCKAVTYCSLSCQKLHWFTHSKMCRSLQDPDADLEKNTPRLKEIKEDESNLVTETANFLQELCLRAEEKVAAAGGCPADLLACSSTSVEGPHLAPKTEAEQ
ncbi:ankyrin repeat and MYND domain-containing protein 2-like isoform X3 [Amphiprion ocellaris]|uniref:ankyrin repeat and MYND domain-containing protein 2-like isoform X3 n=1 Tax=Amphiprion ocellaris TaxID=80972 RepID=UPI002410E71F|nr:ankyrin repeat and MYND domain-containing protein 2-like isoform X3 [Amphiprion ocellaris]